MPWMWIFFVLLGLTLYFIVKQSVVRITTTPWWQLWLALMIPVFVIAGWVLAQRTPKEMPSSLLIASFILSTVLYMALVSANPRQTPQPSETAASVTAEGDDIEALKPTSPVALNAAEQAQLQNCFPWSVYYLQNIDLRPQAVICRGQLRSEPEVAYHNISQNVQAEFGDRFLVLFQDSGSDQPFFALVANPYTKQAQQRQLTRPVLALTLLVLTLLTTTWAGVNLSHPNFTESMVRENPQLLWSGLTYALPLLVILGIHELGHYLAAQLYKIKTTLPYFIPLPPYFFSIGTFGAYIQVRSPIPHRKALFDVGIAGPLAGLVITLPVLVWGLMQSDLAALPNQGKGLSLDAFNPSFSFTFALLCRLIFGQNLTADTGVDLHPMAVAGWLGLMVTALNLMPFGQLDGGHIVHAMYGQRMGVVIGQVCRILVLLLSFFQPVFLFWAILLLLMPAADEPALNDVSELDNYRDGLGLLALGILLLIILPVPNGLAPLFFTNPTP
jgi:membrane-associated protease RseP (regulator of RpoE activity)